MNAQHACKITVKKFSAADKKSSLKTSGCKIFSTYTVMWSTAGNDVIDKTMSKLDCDQSAGPHSRQGVNWTAAQRPPQLTGLHKNSKKIITQGNIKILLETDNLE